ncbi:MAG TPA: hypothetical protein VIL34_01285 [Actinopolymorphaceae bacterium]
MRVVLVRVRPLIRLEMDSSDMLRDEGLEMLDERLEWVDWLETS